LAKWLSEGMGRTGVAACLTLNQQDKRVVGLDTDPTVLESLLAEGGAWFMAMRKIPSYGQDCRWTG